MSQECFVQRRQNQYWLEGEKEPFVLVQFVAQSSRTLSEQFAFSSSLLYLVFYKMIIFS